MVICISRNETPINIWNFYSEMTDVGGFYWRYLLTTSPQIQWLKFLNDERCIEIRLDPAHPKVKQIGSFIFVWCDRLPKISFFLLRAKYCIWTVFHNYDTFLYVDFPETKILIDAKETHNIFILCFVPFFIGRNFNGYIMKLNMQRRQVKIYLWSNAGERTDK